METISLPKGRFVEGAMPLYADISLVTAERHGIAGVLEASSFAFARTATAIPITADEFEQAALDYPIVFLGPLRRAFAVTGLQEGRNAFVEAGGGYRPGAYLPAYLRRHPFVLVQDPDHGQWVLGVDEFSTRLAPLSEPGAQPLFVDGAPAEATRDAVAFCEAYANAERRTDALAELLDELDLFEVRQAHRHDGAEGPVLLLDYAAVSRDRLEALEGQALARLREIGALGPIYAHLLSESNWDRLAFLAR